MKDPFLEYFGMSKTPFGKDLSKEELFNYPQLEDLGEVIRLTVKDRSMCLVSGRSGSGKTTGARAFLEELPHQQYKIIYLGQDQRASGLFARLADALGLRAELSRNYRSLLSIILLGQIWIRDRLRYRELEALNQRLRLRYALEGLTEKQTAQYIHHHLLLAGCSEALFTTDALKQIFLASGGLLRPINNIAFACLVKSRSSNKKTIDGALVKRIVQEQEVL